MSLRSIFRYYYIMVEDRGVTKRMYAQKEEKMASPKTEVNFGSITLKNIHGQRQAIMCQPTKNQILKFLHQMRP